MEDPEQPMTESPMADKVARTNVEDNFMMLLGSDTASRPSRLLARVYREVGEWTTAPGAGNVGGAAPASVETKTTSMLEACLG